MFANESTPDNLNNGYFGLAHRMTAWSCDRRRIWGYIGRFKHALLFTPRLILADHMVVNSPNFRRAFQKDLEFRKLIHKDFIELAHFDRHKDGGHFTLQELRDFYKRLELFHPKIDGQFQTEQFDSELDAIQSNVTRLFPDAAKRDPLFTQFAVEALENGTLKPVLRDLHGAYATAHRLMQQDYPILGQIHFDAEHTSKGDHNVFDYMARLSSMRISKAELIELFGQEVAAAHRALIIKCETQLLGCQAILPAELMNYRTLVVKNADLSAIDKNDREVYEIPIDLSAIGVQTLSRLSCEKIRNLRLSDEGLNYFENINKISSDKLSFSELAKSVEKYACFISLELERENLAIKSRKQSVLGKLRVLRGRLHSGDEIREAGIATVVQVVSHVLDFKTFGLASTINFLGKKVNKKLKDSTAPTPLIDDVRAHLEGYGNSHRITQYE